MSKVKPTFGVGLRNKHYSHMENAPKVKVDFFEVITENYLDTAGRPKQILKKVREQYPVHLHGVSMNIGAKTKVSKIYLDKLKALINEIQPAMVSDHLCWTGLAESNFHNLLPFPYNEESLDHLCDQIDFVQNYLGRQMVFENLSAYFDYKNSSFTEWDFFKIVLDRTDCKMLFDVNNVYVNSVNQNFDPALYLEAIPAQAVAQMHLAGYSDMGDFLFDTHSKPVYPAVWELYKLAAQKFNSIPTLIEWDEEIPEYSVLEAEAMKAKNIHLELGNLN